VADTILLGILAIIPIVCTAVIIAGATDNNGSPDDPLGLLVFCGFCGSILLLAALYYGAFWLWRGQTPGKMLARIKIVGPTGERPGAGTVLMRLMGYFMSTVTLGIGFALAAFDERRQGLHDRVANTFVVPVEPPRRPRPPSLPGYPPAPAAAMPPPAPAAPPPPPPGAAAQIGAAAPPRDSPPAGVQWGPPPPAGAAGAAPEDTARYAAPGSPPAMPAPAGEAGGAQWGSPSPASQAPAPIPAPSAPGGTVFYAPPGGAALPSTPPAEAAPAPAAPPAPSPAAEQFRRGLDLLAEGVREPGGNRTLLIVEPEAGQAAASAFETALATAPWSGVYRYFLGVARRYGEGYAAAEPEFRQAAQQDPTLWEVPFQLYFGTRWHDAFAYPDWSPRAAALPPVLQMLRPPRPGTRLVLVREGGAKTVAALCVTARDAWHHPPTGDMPARIQLVPVRSPYGTVIAFYLAVRDNPTDPYRGETFLNPAEALGEDGDATQLGQNLLLQLARQDHIYLIFVDENGTVLHNRRLVFDPPTLANLAQVAPLVQSIAAGGQVLPAERFAQAAQWHMDQYPLERVTI
jgi:uncharacterized RDD family membrane protein YckC